MTLQVIGTIAALRAELAARRQAGQSIGLAPTMGALHEGHGALIRRSARENACTVVSVFVNPTQFNDADDYRLYPRTPETDVALCRDWGAQIVFAPAVPEMYPEPPLAHVDVERVSGKLCGAFRPGHFRGVATVVAKLFHIVQPQKAYFGQKDAQQLAVIRRMVGDLNFPVEIVAVPTVREPDGLAMSSRNRRLSAEERRQAPRIYQALLEAARAVEAGTRQAGEVRRRGLALLGDAGFRVEYFEVVDPDTIQPVDEIAGTVLIAAAAWLGPVRLIDNILARGPS